MDQRTDLTVVLALLALYGPVVHAQSDEQALSANKIRPGDILNISSLHSTKVHPVIFRSGTSDAV